MRLKEMPEKEVLAKLLDFTKTSNKVVLAEKLLERFGSLKEVFDAEKSELSCLVPSREVSLITFVREFVPIYAYLKIKEAQNLSSPTNVIDYLTAELSGSRVEKLYALLLTSGNRLIASIEVEEGTENKSVVIPRKIAKLCLEYGATSVILSHNHPGGTLKPSQNDIDATNSVKDALRLIDVSLLDHIIIAHNEYFSFKEYNLI